MSPLAEQLASKKFRAAIASTVVAIAAHFGFQMDTETVFTILSPLLLYIAGQAVADVGKGKAQAEAALEEAKKQRVQAESQLAELVDTHVSKALHGTREKER